MSPTKNHKIKVDISNLTLHYSSNCALKDVNIQIPEQHITALIGPSGCGKSTFLRVINRMNDLIPGVKTTGKIILDGKNIYKGNTDLAQLRRRVGMVFQKPNPFPMTIYENVAYGPKVHGIRNKKSLDKIVEKSLQAAALWDEVGSRLHAPALGLSGGQQQRLCIARVLAVEPEVLLMDEPTSALDPISTLKIEELLQRLRKEYTIIIVTHNMQQAARISGTTAFFLNGEIIEWGGTSQIFTNPRKKQTEDYITGRFG